MAFVLQAREAVIARAVAGGKDANSTPAVTATT